MHLHIISSKQAKAIGLKFYFTGKPCPRGGIDLRFTSNQQCACQACRAASNENNRIKRKGNPKVAAAKKEYHAKNGEAIRARKRELYRENPQVHLERTKRWREANVDHLKEYTARYRADNIERVRASAKAWYERNKVSIRDRYAAYYADNIDEMRARSRRYYQSNREAVIAKYKEYRLANIDAVNARHRCWCRRNPDKIKHYIAKRRAAIEQRIPAWFGELDEFVLAEAFAVACAREEATGFAWHVDHMIPLRARHASGLHCAANVQVIPGYLNSKKYNKMILTEPDEWLSRLV